MTSSRRSWVMPIMSLTPHFLSPPIHAPPALTTRSSLPFSTMRNSNSYNPANTVQGRP